MTKVTSVRLDDDLAARLDRLASALERPKAWVIEQAVARYVEDEAWQVEAIRAELEEYRAEARAGKVTGKPHEEVMAEIYARVANNVPA